VVVWEEKEVDARQAREGDGVVVVLLYLPTYYLLCWHAIEQYLHHMQCSLMGLHYQYMTGASPSLHLHYEHHFNRAG